MASTAPANTAVALNTLDWVLVIVYFSALVLAIWLSTRKSSRAGSGTQSKPASEMFFLAGRSTTFFAVGASLFMSNIGSEHFIALAAAGATSGLAVASFEWMASIFVGVVLGRVFAPFYLRNSLHTVPKFLELRYAAGARRYHALATIMMAILTKVSATLYSGAIILRVLLGWPVWFSLIMILVLTTLYTSLGGLRAVIWTEVLQAFVLLAGGLALAVRSLQAVGSLAGLSELLAAQNRRQMLDLLQWPSSTTPWVEYPWPGIIFGLPALEVFYWCTDQVVVQRVLSAKSEAHARGGSLLCGFLKTLVPFMMVIPGLCAFLLFPEVAANPNQAYPTAVARLLPHGLLGLMVSAMLAALMSSLASTFNSTSTVVVYDFVIECCGLSRLSDKTLVLLGRIANIVLCAFSLAWIPIVEGMGEELYFYIQSVISYIAPPIAVVFVAGIAWRRATATGALCTLLVGGALGLVRFVVEVALRLAHREAPLGALGKIFFQSNFLYFAIFSWVFSSLLLVTVSLFTEPPSEQQLGLLFQEASASGSHVRTTAGNQIGESSSKQVVGASRYVADEPSSSDPAARQQTVELEIESFSGTENSDEAFSVDPEHTAPSMKRVASRDTLLAGEAASQEPLFSPQGEFSAAQETFSSAAPSRLTSAALDVLSVVLVAEILAFYIQFR
jgi:SSS family solute:Na+ symporter